MGIKICILAAVATIFVGHCQADSLESLLGKNYDQLLDIVVPFKECNALTSSQFAYACQIAELLPDPTLKVFGQQSADGTCDGDCRCIMGAASGRCGKRPSDNKTFCRCDYQVRDPPVPNLALTPCSVTSTLGQLCKQGVLAIPPISNFLDHTACNVDCVCSHGYPNSTVANTCHNGTTEYLPGIPNNYCICANGVNAW